MVFSHVIRGRPGGLFQFSVGGAIRITLASASLSMRAVCTHMERRRDWIIACRVRLLGYPPHLLIVNKLVPFDSKQVFSNSIDHDATKDVCKIL